MSSLLREGVKTKWSHSLRSCDCRHLSTQRRGALPATLFSSSLVRFSFSLWFRPRLKLQHRSGITSCCCWFLWDDVKKENAGAKKNESQKRSGTGWNGWVENDESGLRCVVFLFTFVICPALPGLRRFYLSHHGKMHVSNRKRSGHAADISAQARVTLPRRGTSSHVVGLSGRFTLRNEVRFSLIHANTLFSQVTERSVSAV